MTCDISAPELCVSTSSFQNSFYKLMMGSDKSEKFFKVLYDHMKNAHHEVKSTVSVNVSELGNKVKEDKELEAGIDGEAQHSTLGRPI